MIIQKIYKGSLKIHKTEKNTPKTQLTENKKPSHYWKLKIHYQTLAFGSHTATTDTLQTRVQIIVVAFPCFFGTQTKKFTPPLCITVHL